jgi:Tfp pilus assembly protein PilX
MSIKKAIFGLANNKGQALLIIVLVMVVALTVGLSVASRTITNLRNSRDQASSQQALSAAEAGIERAIVGGNSTIAGSFSGNTTYNTTVASVSGTTAFLLNGGNLVPKNDAVYLWVTPWSAVSSNLWQNPWTGNLTLYWGDSTGACNNAAVEVTVINGPKTNPTITRHAYDPCNARTGSNNFTSVNSNPISISGRTLTYRAVIAITNGLLVRVNPIYSGAYFGSSGSVALPTQGNVITSVGTSDSSTQRKLNVYQGYPEIPAELFPYTIFSP